MSPKLSGRKVRDVKKALKKLGFHPQPGRGKASHEVYWNPNTDRYTTVSHKNGTVPTGTLKRIAKDLDVDQAAFLQLL